MVMPTLDRRFYFDIDGEKVWGATAMALAEFLTMLKQSA